MEMFSLLHPASSVFFEELQHLRLFWGNKKKTVRGKIKIRYFLEAAEDLFLTLKC